tara:strand:+ start:227 stop:358 length:132 start_codon:yes stop_codon:yes gene_type:complete
MTVAKPKARRRSKPQNGKGDNKFFLYVMFYHFFEGLAGIFKDD